MLFNPATWVPALSASNLLWSPPGTPGVNLSSLLGQPDPTFVPPRVIANGEDITRLFDGTSNPEFPPRDWLGYGIDMTSVTPVDITAVGGAVLRLSRLIKLEEGGEKRQYGDVSWTVPKGVGVNQDLKGGKGDYVSYSSGDKVLQAIETDAELKARYLAVSGDASGGYAVEKTFQKNFQYGILTWNDILIIVGFEDFAPAVNEPLLRLRMNRIAKFDPQNVDVVEDYRSLFKTIGTHVITGASYGSRLSLLVWASNDDQKVDQNFNLDVGAEFHGLTTDGKVKAGIDVTNQFQIFEQSMGKANSCKGGDPTLSGKLDSNPRADGVFQTYQKWINSTNTRPNIMKFETMALWDLMTAGKDDVVARRAVDVRKAYKWIVENPKEHLTKARLIITSNWGTFALSTPSAFIMRDMSVPIPKGTVFSPTKIQWDAQSGVQSEITIEFTIHNDGSPVDIELSHGTAGSTPASGLIRATFGPNGKNYTNDRLLDNNWNTQVFHGCPVDPHGWTAPQPKEVSEVMATA